MCGGVMRSLGDSKTPVIAITIAALLNIVLDYTFILAFHMGVEGAAWATVISQLISGLWCLLVIRKRFTILKMQPEDKRIRAPFVRRLLAMGIPFGLQYSITAIGSLTVTYAVNGIGTIAVAAVTAGGKLSMFFCCVFDALASTMATFAGQNVGAKKLDRINQGLKASSIIGCIYCVLAFVAIYFFGKPLVGLFISQDSANRQMVIDMAQQFLIINSALYIPLLFVNIVRFSIQGLGYTMITMIAGLMELVGRAVVAMLFVPSLGYDAACFANPVAWILADLFLFPCYFSCIRKLRKRMYPHTAAAKVIFDPCVCVARGFLLLCGLIFVSCRGNRRCGGNQRAFRSPFGNLRSSPMLLDLYWSYLVCVLIVHQTKKTNTIDQKLPEGVRSSPEGDRKALWSRPQARNPASTRGNSMKKSPTQSRGRVKGQ